MKFFDKVEIVVQSGRGGDGAVSGRREKYVPHGGPSGGDGGAGGSVILEASKDENTLLDYRYQKLYRASDGGEGESRDRFGKSAENLVLKVPEGVVVKDQVSGKILGQLLGDGDRIKIAKGGDGGSGNINFKNSVRQFPTFALKGEPGEKKKIVLELQMLGDVALIGTPSVGKSTIINTISNVKAKTADYDFTTLVPNIGVLKYRDYSRTVIDIPGLIEGASEGKGLGDEFLRHILKAKIFAFVFDLTKYERGIEDFSKLFEEIKGYVRKRFAGDEDVSDIETEIKIEEGNIVLEFYVLKGEDKELFLRKMVYFVLNKYDEIDDQQILDEYMSQLLDELNSSFGMKISKDFLQENISVLSAATFYGRDSFLEAIYKKLTTFQDRGIAEFNIFQEDEETHNYIKDVTENDIDYLVSRGYIEKEQAENLKVREVSDSYLSYLVFVLPWGNDEAEMRFRDRIRRLGYISLLEKEGVQKGDILKIRSFYEGEDDKYILFE